MGVSQFVFLMLISTGQQTFQCWQQQACQGVYCFHTIRIVY